MVHLLDTWVGLVLQAGGNGKRFMNTNNPKPIYPLKKSHHETCLLNILKEVPEWVNVFLHIQPKQEKKYKAYVQKQSFPHRIHYIYQDISYLFEEDGEVRTFNGRHVMAPNGPGNFGPRLEEIVNAQNLTLDFIAVYDACKKGIYYGNIIDGVKRLVMEERSVLAYTRLLSQKQIEEEKKRLRNGDHPRYDRLLDEKLFEKYNIPRKIVENPEAKALSGMNIFRYDMLIRSTRNMRGRKLKVVNHSEKKKIVAPGNSYYYDFRITNVINGFGFFDKLFPEQDKNHYFKSIKYPGDL